MLYTSVLVLTLIRPGAQPELVRLNIDGVERQAWVVPASRGTGKHPLVFAFHGHGGNGTISMRKFQVHAEWPEATVIYPTGLPTRTLRDLEGKKNGWQNAEGLNGNRDLKFFDALLNQAKKEGAIDTKRIYVMGHSNGAGFTYLLWRVRGDHLAAVAPIAGTCRRLDYAKPVPVLHIGGTDDPIVDFDNQVATVEIARKVNGCSSQSTPYGPKGCVIWDSAKGAPVAFYTVQGGKHEVPKNATELIIKFFKEHPRK